MLLLDLVAIPNQRFQFVADNQSYDIRLISADDIMLMDITVNGTPVVSAVPCLPNQQVLTSKYLEGNGGNFFWSTASGNNPQYQNFGATDLLFYASVAEMATARSNAT